jgi:lipopolysaccharide/colanic/teichoic acid biosynthesis glycosyltransferase
VYTFPESFNDKDEVHSIDLPIYPDLCEEKQDKRGSFVVKRLMDIVGSACALVVLSPVVAALAIAVKATSKGPVFFRQKRVGQRGRSFVFLKFRSMFVANDPSIHRNYVAAFIAGKVQSADSTDAAGEIYKIIDDPRVTGIGRLMRRLSLDEIPQFWNVLVGEMSLVGPRPPIPYEIDAYDVWHRRRFLEVKPGITGLWQVQGRSKTTFDEMVRLDLRYSKTWSPAVDLKILIQTPKAVFSGEGAY